MRLKRQHGRARAGLALGGRKGKVAGCFQFPQRLQAAIALGVAARVVEVELLAQEIGQLGPVDELAIGNGRGLREGPLDLVLNQHADSMRRGELFVEHYLRVKGSGGTNASGPAPFTNVRGGGG